MHKAKGLEFDTVILPGLGARHHRRPAAHPPLVAHPGSTGLPGIRKAGTPPFPGQTPEGQRPLTLPQGATMPSLPIKAPPCWPCPPPGVETTAMPCSPTWTHWRKAREDAERKRLLYVAGTRARNRLHLLIGLARKEETEGPGEFRPTTRTMAGDLQEALLRLFDEQPPPPLPARQRSARIQRFVNPVIHRVPADLATAQAARALWSPPAPEEGPLAVVCMAAGERARVLGLTVHRWLQEVAEKGPDAFSPEHIEALRPRTRRMLQFHGVPADELESLTVDVETALRNTLDDEKGRWTLERHKDAASELPLSLQEEGRTRSLILDRSFVHAGERWIIDYKTSRHEGANLDGRLPE